MTDNTKLHAAIAAIDARFSDLSRVVAAGGAATLHIVQLQAAWVDLIRLLALPPPLELRNCPRCHREVMRAATRCGFCWIALTPPAGS